MRAMGYVGKENEKGTESLLIFFLDFPPAFILSDQDEREVFVRAHGKLLHLLQECRRLLS